MRCRSFKVIGFKIRGDIVPFHVINKIPVFLTWEKDKELRAEVYGVENVFGSYIKRSGVKDKHYKLFEKALNNKYRLDPSVFIKEWSEFDLKGEDAMSNVWDLIYDYCAFYGCGYTSVIRNDVESLTDDYMGESFTFPQGKVFALNHYVAPSRWYWKYTRNKKGKVIRTIIDSTRIRRIVGDLSDFRIIFDDRILRCGSIFEVVEQ